MPYSPYAAPLLHSLARRMQSRLGCKVDPHRLDSDAVYTSAINTLARGVRDSRLNRLAALLSRLHRPPA